MQIFKEHEKNFNGIILRKMPKEIHFTPNKPSVAEFADGTRSSICCLHCSRPLCMQFFSESVKCREVTDFPCDNNIDVCPVNAISWDETSDIPTIDNKSCIKCGACVRSCPVGALYYDGSEIKAYTKIEVEHTYTPIPSFHFKHLGNLLGIPMTGKLIQESDELMKSIYDLLSREKSNIHNNIGRNLLVSFGNACAMRRIGDVYTRMDAIYLSLQNNFGVVEIEFGKDTLDASRGILDDIAILNARYNIPKEQISPLVICLRLPNARQGYWQVIKDVHRVEQISVKTISIGALMILNWNLCFFDPSDSLFYLDYDNMDLRAKIEKVIERPVQISNNLLGILEPEK